jgi:parvulin-like peptidyl-prolyl isomerase
VAKAKSHGFTAAEGGIQESTPGSLMCEALNEALATLDVGRMSDGIESPQGFHLVRVLERKEPGRTSFEVAQAKIRDLLEAEQKEVLVTEELKKLRKSARVWTIFHGDLNGPRLSELLENKPQRR